MKKVILLSKSNPFGEELLSNGDFSDGSTNWSSTNANITYVDNADISPTSSLGYINSTEALSTTSGISYKFSFDCISRTGGGVIVMQVGTFATGSNVTSQNIGTIANGNSYSIDFTASSTSSYVRIAVQGSGSNAVIDNVSVKEIL